MVGKGINIVDAVLPVPRRRRRHCALPAKEADQRNIDSSAALLPMAAFPNL